MSLILLFPVIYALLFPLDSLVLGAAPSPETLAERIAEAYGLREFPRVEEIRFTFNAKVGKKHITRSWAWEPKTDLVTYERGNGLPSVTYHRREVEASPSEQLRKVDSMFINDQYWLLFPLHLVWDRDIAIEVDADKAPLPIGSGTARRVVVKYPPTGGYTPGDVYELFIDDDYRILEWIYRRGGSEAPTRIATWEDHRKIGPLTLSLDHYGAGKEFRVWFTGVEIKTTTKAESNR